MSYDNAFLVALPERIITNSDKGTKSQTLSVVNRLSLACVFVATPRLCICAIENLFQVAFCSTINLINAIVLHFHEVL